MEQLLLLNICQCPRYYPQIKKKQAWAGNENPTLRNHLKKCGLFLDFQYGFRSSRSTADLLTVVSDRIARAFNRSGATRAVALDISKAFDRVWHAGLLHKLFQVRYLALFLLFSVIDDFEWFWMESLYKNIQVMQEFLKAPSSTFPTIH